MTKTKKQTADGGVALAGVATSVEVRALSAGLESLTLDEVLGWAWDNFGPRAAIGTSLQGAGLVIMHRAVTLGFAFPAFTLDTGVLFPETLALREEIERRLGISIERVRPEISVEEQAAEHGAELWRRHPDLCCTLRKVLPLHRRLGASDMWITGLRRQHSSDRARTTVLERYLFDPLQERYIFKLNPLAGWSRLQVRAYLHEHGIPYNSLKDRGYVSIGCQPCTRPVGVTEDDRAGRWTGFEKTECGIHTFLGESV